MAVAPRRWGRPRWTRGAVTALVGFGVVTGIVLASFGLLVAQGNVRFTGSDSVPEKAPAAAAWAGFPDTAGMKVLDFRHRDLGGAGEHFDHGFGQPRPVGDL